MKVLMVENGFKILVADYQQSYIRVTVSIVSLTIRDQYLKRKARRIPSPTRGQRELGHHFPEQSRLKSTLPVI